MVSEEVAEIQKEFFREIYIENTEGNMGGIIIDEKYFELLAEGFFTAIGKTSYEIIDSQFNGMDEAVIVTIEVKGIDDYPVSMQTEEDMREIMEDKDLSQEELIENNLEVSANNYAEYEEILEPIKIDVLVPILNEDEFYFNQDDYL